MNSRYFLDDPQLPGPCDGRDFLESMRISPALSRATLEAFTVPPETLQVLFGTLTFIPELTVYVD